MNFLNKCLDMNTGLKIITPDENIVKSYLEQAENTLKRAKKLIEEQDFLWASVTTYYAAYYSLYAFLQKLGIKSENHDCSIALIEYLLNEKELVENLFSLKESRKDGQYYLKFTNKDELIKNHEKAKLIFIEFYNLCKLEDANLKKYKIKLKKLFAK